jgi:aryl-alcohol dehydrogenase-like predicted oxidoreductase
MEHYIMQYTHLGRTGLKVSRLCLGTMNFGPFTTEADSFGIMDAAYDLGINFWDTADEYGRVPGEGVTEQIVGNWIAKNPGKRNDIILGTKVYNTMNRKKQKNPNLGRCLSASKIIKGCEASLRRLKTEYIDLYQMHHVDRNCPWEELWQAMETLVAQGKIVYTGSSNFAGWDIATANQIASHRHFLGLVSEQSVYNLTNRMIELEVIPACKHYGLGLLPWSPLAGGLLAGALEKQANGRRSGESYEKALEKKRSQLQAYEDLCKDIGKPPSIVGLAWLLSNPAVTAPIIGPRTIEQLNDALTALTCRLHELTIKKLDVLFPGPGGEAPNAYAW